jgi:carboxyl-terminal processing protease
VVREGEGSPLTVNIERAVIKVASVKSRTLEPGYGYLRISNFQARTTETCSRPWLSSSRKTKAV